MAHISLKNVSLTHPVFGAGHEGKFSDGADEKLVRTKSGRLFGVRALDDLSLELKDGDRVGVIGANGSGKTTLLKVLAGILRPEAGVVHVVGRATNLININLGLKTDATGHRNITLQALAAGQSLRDIDEKRQAIEEFSELGDFLNLPVNSYSSGMRMRLSFSVATAFAPEILLLDEWLSAGDERFRAKAKERMNSFVDTAGILVLASHSLSLLADVCTEIIWLDNGKLMKRGPVEEVFAAYTEASRASA